MLGNTCRKNENSFASYFALRKQALEILRKLQPLTDYGQYVFPSARRGGRPLSENDVLAAFAHFALHQCSK